MQPLNSRLQSSFSKLTPPRPSPIRHLIPRIHSGQHVIADVAVKQPDPRRIRDHVGSNHLRGGDSKNIRALARTSTVLPCQCGVCALLKSPSVATYQRTWSPFFMVIIGMLP